MNRLRPTNAIAVLALVAVALASVGCQTGASAKQADLIDDARVIAEFESRDSGKYSVVHTNEAGKVACPITGSEVGTSLSKASYVDYKARRYYFCCSKCPKYFMRDPEKYADKADQTDMVASTDLIEDGDSRSFKIQPGRTNRP